jgi:phosphoribosylamine--glycine ligase
VDDMISGGIFGAAGATVVIEEFMDGEEASFFALVDGTTAVPLASAQDHKAVGEGDTGPNTGGMGAYTPAPVVPPEMEQTIMRDVILPTVKGMAAEGCPFQGVLFAGIMIQNGKPRLLEYNVRFGDPECQTLMMRLQSDLLPLLEAAADGTLADVRIPPIIPHTSLATQLFFVCVYVCEYVTPQLFEGVVSGRCEEKLRVGFQWTKTGITIPRAPPQERVHTSPVVHARPHTAVARQG